MGERKKKRKRIDNKNWGGEKEGVIEIIKREGREHILNGNFFSMES